MLTLATWCTYYKDFFILGFRNNLMGSNCALALFCIHWRPAVFGFWGVIMATGWTKQMIKPDFFETHVLDFVFKGDIETKSWGKFCKKKKITFIKSIGDLTFPSHFRPSHMCYIVSSCIVTEKFRLSSPFLEMFGRVTEAAVRRCSSK